MDPRMIPRQIRPVALCLFSNQGKILVQEFRDTKKHQRFYRPLGGGIEFGERGSQTIHREIMEELDEKVVNLNFLGCLENLFTHEGIPSHEIVLLYDGAFKNPALYGTKLDVKDDSGGACWLNLEEIRAQNKPLYPDGLPEFLVSYLANHE